MESIAAQLKRGISRQFSSGSLRRNMSRQFTRQASLDPRRNNLRFSFGRQSSLDPIRRSPVTPRDGEDDQELTVPDNLDSTMQLLFMACRGDVKGVEDLLNDGIDVNSIDLDGRTALHIAACEGHVEVCALLLSRKANIDARDRWGSTAAADAKYYGNTEVYYMLKARREFTNFACYHISPKNRYRRSISSAHRHLRRPIRIRRRRCRQKARTTSFAGREERKREYIN